MEAFFIFWGIGAGIAIFALVVAALVYLLAGAIWLLAKVAGRTVTAIQTSRADFERAMNTETPRPKWLKAAEKRIERRTAAIKARKRAG